MVPFFASMRVTSPVIVWRATKSPADMLGDAEGELGLVSLAFVSLAFVGPPANAGAVPSAATSAVASAMRCQGFCMDVSSPCRLKVGTVSLIGAYRVPANARTYRESSFYNLSKLAPGRPDPYIRG